jgi:hypothetical protein
METIAARKVTHDSTLDAWNMALILRITPKARAPPNITCTIVMVFAMLILCDAVEVAGF